MLGAVASFELKATKKKLKSVLSGGNLDLCNLRYIQSELSHFRDQQNNDMNRQIRCDFDMILEQVCKYEYDADSFARLITHGQNVGLLSLF